MRIWSESQVLGDVAVMVVLDLVLVGAVILDLVLVGVAALDLVLVWAVVLVGALPLAAFPAVLGDRVSGNMQSSLLLRNAVFAGSCGSF